jgi:hypothetical protein
VGNEVLLKGKYIELGIHSVGSFGTMYVVCLLGEKLSNFLSTVCH